MDQMATQQSDPYGLQESAILQAELDDLLANGTGGQVTPNVDLQFEDFADFSKHLPTFIKPDQPCDYCRSKKLDCHMYFGKITCTACDSLWRPCSFAHVQSAPTGNAQRGLDTLHIVEEDVCTDSGALTGNVQLRSTAGRSRSSRKPAPRFSIAAVKVLKEWFDMHKDYPYPSEDEKTDLERRSGLTMAQISTWLANTRRRTKEAARKSDSPPSGSDSSGASVATVSAPIEIAAGVATKEWRDLNPFERWQHSPPENEPARIDDIAWAIASRGLDQDESSTSSGSGNTPRSNSGRQSSHSVSNHQAPSVTSFDTSHKSSKSSAAYSHGSGSSFGSFGSFGSGLNGKRDRQRKRKSRLSALRRTSEDKASRPMQCTFCTDRFKTKYDWTRHEKSLHLSLEKWVCTPNGPTELDAATGQTVCAYCRHLNPDSAHIESHAHHDCAAKGVEAKTFFRKDHLRQHLRLVHHVPLTKPMDAWRSSLDAFKSRCGFCSVYFSSWAERNEHLAAHFRAGADMRDWKRCLGFEPEIAAQVTNAMPPYLIGNEALTANPFSASAGGQPCTGSEWVNGGECGSASGQGTCWELLVVLLARYTESQARMGVVVTDEMLHSEARRILYGDNDAWNQTPADQPEFLDLFKKAYCMDMIPEAVGGVGRNAPEDLELFTDLGLKIPFELKQKASARIEQTKLYHEGTGNYDSIPLLASRVRHLACPPPWNPVVDDERGDGMVLPPAGQEEMAQFVNMDMLDAVDWDVGGEMDFGELAF